MPGMIAPGLMGGHATSLSVLLGVVSDNVGT